LSSSLFKVTKKHAFNLLIVLGSIGSVAYQLKINKVFFNDQSGDNKFHLFLISAISTSSYLKAIFQ